MTRREIIIHYARDCLDDKFPACKKHKWMCQRLLRDFDRLDNDPDYPYYWDETEAEKIVKWFTYLRHQKGELAGQPINLTPWQQSHICQLYGWRRKDNDRRRFTKMMIQVARKNAKTQEEAGVCLYEMSVTAKKNGEMMELFTAGGKKEESKKCFDEAGNLLNGSPLRPKFQINRSEIRYPDTGSYLKMLSKDDGKNGDGSNPAVLVLDKNLSRVNRGVSVKPKNRKCNISGKLPRDELFEYRNLHNNKRKEWKNLYWTVNRFKKTDSRP